MRGHMAVSLFGLVFGALGTVTGAVMPWAGAALLIRSRLVSFLVPATAYLSVPTFLISGVYKHYAGWPITLVGIVYPLITLFWCRMDAKR